MLTDGITDIFLKGGENPTGTEHATPVSGLLIREATFLFKDRGELPIAHPTSLFPELTRIFLKHPHTRESMWYSPFCF